MGTDQLVGQVVEGRYLVEAELGAGGMGTVFRARHISLRRSVAIKVLHRSLVSDPAMVERFEREAAIAARLDHENLVNVLDVGETADGRKLMVLELARGTSLAELATQPMAPARVVAIVRQLLRGLAHAHAHGLVHRDLKPENVMVETRASGDELARIVDFGIAVLREPDDTIDTRRLTGSGVVLGTPQYMSPEQAQGHVVDHRTDLFALGVSMYELLAGMPPFEGSGVEMLLANVTQDAPPFAERAGVRVDPQLEAFVLRLMARRLRHRFSSATEALEALEALATPPRRQRTTRRMPKVAMRPLARVPTVRRRITQRGAVYAMLVAALVGGACLAFA